MTTKFLSGLMPVFLIISLLSCTNSNKRNSSLPSVSGAAGEILVVIDKAKWDSKLGDTIRWAFSSLIPVTIMTEPYFNLAQIQSSALTSTYNRHRNILVIDIKENVKPGLYFKEDQWSSPQIVISLIAPSVEEAIQTIIREGEAMRDKFINKEVDRWVNILKRSFDPKVISDLKTKHNYWIATPKGYSLDVNKKGFFWISSESPDIILGIIGWDYPYTSKDQLTPENLIKKRNEVVKLNVPGPVEKSFMTTDMNFPRSSKETIYKGRYFMQIEGVWKLDGAFMGGPFINYTTIDDAGKRIITVEGFINAPHDDKKNLMRQLAGILYTLDVVKPEPDKNN